MSGNDDAARAIAAVAAMDERIRDVLLIGWLCSSAPAAVLAAVRELEERRAPQPGPVPCTDPVCGCVSHVSVTA